MITAHYTEIRSRKLPGQPTETIIRTVNSTNGRGRKTVRVLRGNRTVSSITEPLTPTENTNIQVRRFTPNLYGSPEQKTLKQMKKTKRLTKKAPHKTRRS
jgi:hypothetical protein